jgi:hypothetical protein
VFGIPPPPGTAPPGGAAGPCPPPVQLTAAHPVPVETHFTSLKAAQVPPVLGCQTGQGEPVYFAVLLHVHFAVAASQVQFQLLGRPAGPGPVGPGIPGTGVKAGGRQLPGGVPQGTGFLTALKTTHPSKSTNSPPVPPMYPPVLINKLVPSNTVPVTAAAVIAPVNPSTNTYTCHFT